MTSARRHRQQVHDIQPAAPRSRTCGNAKCANVCRGRRYKDGCRIMPGSVRTWTWAAQPWCWLAVLS
jgi:hypothetical protein